MTQLANKAYLFRRRALSVVLVLLILSGVASAQQTVYKEGVPSPQSIILKLHPGMGISANGVLSFYSSMRGAHLSLLPNLNMAVLEAPAGWDIEMLAEALQRDPAVRQAIVDTSRITVESAGGRKEPNDPLFSRQWYLDDISGNDADIDAPGGWAYETGSTEVVIAVFDTGIDYLHPDIKNNLWVNQAEADGRDGADDDGNGYVDDIHGYDMCNRDGDPWDSHSHGTRVAMAIAAQGNNNYQTAGVAWRIRIMSLRTAECSGGVSALGNMLQSVEYILTMKKRGVPIRVINLSLHAPGFVAVWREVVSRLRDEGILLVVGAGNNGKKVTIKDSFFVDKFYDNVVVVGATDKNRNRPCGGCPGSDTFFASNYNPDLVDLGAPGSRVPAVSGSYLLAKKAYDKSRFSLALFSSAANDSSRMLWTVGDAWTRQGAEWRLEVKPGQGLPGLVRADGDIGTTMLSTMTLESPVIDLSNYSDNTRLLLTLKPYRKLQEASDSVSSYYRYLIQVRAGNSPWETIHEYQLDHIESFLFGIADEAFLIPVRFYKESFQFRFCLGEPNQSIGNQCLWKSDSDSVVNNLIDGSIGEALSLRVGRVAIFDSSRLYGEDSLTLEEVSGTSFSAPLVAGAAALLFSHNPALNYRIVKRAILQGVKKVPALSDDYITSGMLSVQGAFQKLEMTTPAITVDKAELHIDETGGRTLNVALSRRPNAEVRVSIMRDSSGEQIDLSIQQLVFTADNWRQAQQVLVSAPGVDGNHRNRMTTLVFSASGSAEDYQDVRLKVPVTIENFERPVVTIDQAPEIFEGESANGMVRFAIAPQQPFTLRFESDDTQTLLIRPSTLRFTADNWDTPQPFTLFALTDLLSSDNKAATWKLLYADGTVAVRRSLLIIGDDQTAAITINQLDFSTTPSDTHYIDRGRRGRGHAHILDMNLAGQPNTEVTIDIAAEPLGIQLNRSSLVFEPGNYRVAQRIEYTVDDDFEQGAITFTVNNSLSDANYRNTSRTVSVRLRPPVMLPSGLVIQLPRQISQGIIEGKSVEASVWLAAPPAQTTTMRLESDDPQALLIRPSTLQFTPDNWDTPQPFTLFALTDLLSSAERNVVWSVVFAGRTDTFPASIRDNGQVAFITIAQIDNVRPKVDAVYIERERRGSGDYEALDAFIKGKPNTEVSLDVMADSQDLRIVGPRRLVFEPDRHNEYQRVEYMVGGDFEQGTITFTVNNSLSDANYHNVSRAVSIRLRSLVMLTSGLLVQLPRQVSESITEGKSVEASAWLAAPPAQTTTMRLESDDPQALLIRPSTLRFTADNWDTPQPFTLFALTDLLSSAERNVVWSVVFAGRTDTFPVSIKDNGQTAAIVINQLDLSTTPSDTHYIDRERRGRGHAHILDMNLAGQPNTEVTIDIAAEPLGIQLNRSSLVFEPGNYRVAQRIEYTVDDDFEQGTITFTVNNSLSDANYRNTSRTVSVRLRPPVMLPSGLVIQLPRQISQGIIEGKSVEASVWLAAPPAQTTTMRLESDDPQALLIRPDALQFTPDNWDTPQPFTLFALTDLLSSAERNVVWSVVFAGRTDTFPVSIKDNGQTAAIVINQLDLSTTPSDTHYIDRERRGRGHAHILDMNLAGQPNTEVTIDIAAEPLGIQLNRSSLVFEPGNYRVAQRIEYTVDDDFEQGTITFAVNNSLSDANYHNVNRAVSIRVTPTSSQDKLSKLRFDPALLTVAEGSTETIKLEIVSTPLVVVIVELSADSDAAHVAPASLRLGPDTLSHTVEIGVPEDQLARQKQRVVVRATAQSDQTGSYAAEALVNIPANDAPILSIKPETLELNEGESADITIIADRFSPEDVVVRLTLDDEDGLNADDLRGAPYVATLTAGQTTVAITITIMDDEETEDEERGAFALAVDAGFAETDAAFMLTVPASDQPPANIRDADTANENMVAENAPVGATVGITVSADYATSYTLIDDADGRFQADSQSGVIVVKEGAQLDYEANAEHTIIARAGNKAGSTTSPFTIAVSDQNEPVGAITDTDAAPDAIAEDAEPGDTVGITAFAVDNDAGDTVTYSLIGSGSQLFAIDENTGVVSLTTADALDFETMTTYSVIAEARSSDDSTSRFTFMIDITDVNDNGLTAVQDIDTAPDTIAEDAMTNSLVGITAKANDPDPTAEVTYRLIGDNSQLFAIGSQDGVIMLNGQLNYEASKQHTITVRADSSDGSPSTSADFIVNVSNVNEIMLKDTDSATNTVIANQNATVQGLLLQATHPDGSPITGWSLMSDEFALTRPQNSNIQRLKMAKAVAEDLVIKLRVDVSSKEDTNTQEFDINVRGAEAAAIRLRIKVYLEGALR